MIIKVNDKVYLQTRNILEVIDDPEEDKITIYFNTSTQLSHAKSIFSGQDRKDVLEALRIVSFDRRD